MEEFLDSLGFQNKVDRERFHSIMLDLESVPSSFACACILGIKSKFLYYSDKVESILGYPTYKFLNDMDFSFMKFLTPESYIPYVSRRQKEFIDESQKPGFDFRAAQIMSFQAALKNKNGIEIPLIHFSLSLNYTQDGIAQVIVVVNLVEIGNGEEFFFREARVKKLLTDLKRCYVSTFPDRFENIKPKLRPLTLIYNPKSPNFKEPSLKEKEVLKLIARGLSTREIATQTGTTPNTVETHRKHLLEKFEAKNTAELIQKASKVYWLE